MKSYISSGRTEVKNLEATAMASQPPLFHDYANASLAERNIIDAQLRDLKTNARYQSKAGWHNWRSQLLNDLKNGLVQAEQELEVSLRGDIKMMDTHKNSGPKGVHAQHDMDHTMILVPG